MPIQPCNAKLTLSSPRRCLLIDRTHWQGGACRVRTLGGLFPGLMRWVMYIAGLPFPAVLPSRAGINSRLDNDPALSVNPVASWPLLTASRFTPMEHTIQARSYPSPPGPHPKQPPPFRAVSAYLSIPAPPRTASGRYTPTLGVTLNLPFIRSPSFFFKPNEKYPANPRRSLENRTRP